MYVAGIPKCKDDCDVANNDSSLDASVGNANAEHDCVQQRFMLVAVATSPLVNKVFPGMQEPTRRHLPPPVKNKCLRLRARR